MRRTRPVELLFAALLIALPAGPAPAYYEDITSTWSAWSGQSYSTFHYELTRRLALGAGFSLTEAERIASVDAAVDVGTFQGEYSFSPLLVLKGTPRFGDLHTFYHFPRRGLQDSGGNAYPSGTDSCSYFTSTDPCPGGVPEIDTLDRWAVLGSATPSPVPTLSVSGGSAADVAGRSLDSLGIYLHSLADSYSHEECMRLVQKRDHTVVPPQACQLSWHDLEYGPNPPNVAIPYTRNAARAVWKGLLYYRSANPSGGAPTWDDASAGAFIDAWIALFASADRRNYASVGFWALAPCRVVDTRDPVGDFGGPALAAASVRLFLVHAAGCGIPSDARAISANVTVDAPKAAGYLTLFEGSQAAAPLASTLNFRAGDTRANNAVLRLTGDGSGVKVLNAAAGTVEFILDVNGFFR